MNKKMENKAKITKLDDQSKRFNIQMYFHRARTKNSGKEYTKKSRKFLTMKNMSFYIRSSRTIVDK